MSPPLPGSWWRDRRHGQATDQLGHPGSLCLLSGFIDPNTHPQHPSVFSPLSLSGKPPKVGHCPGAEEGRGSWVFCSGSSSEV